MWDPLILRGLWDIGVWCPARQLKVVASLWGCGCSWSAILHLGVGRRREMQAS